MIRSGLVCAKCKNGKCADAPTELEPLEVGCPACNGSGDGCDSCTGGWLIIEQCPQRWLGRWPSQFVRYADLFGKGHNIAGSCVMDETHHFVQMYGFYKSECDTYAPDPFDK